MLALTKSNENHIRHYVPIIWDSECRIDDVVKVSMLKIIADNGEFLVIRVDKDFYASQKIVKWNWYFIRLKCE